MVIKSQRESEWIRLSLTPSARPYAGQDTTEIFKRNVDTVGKNTAANKAYIQNQIKEDLEYDQMSLVE